MSLKAQDHQHSCEYNTVAASTESNTDQFCSMPLMHSFHVERRTQNHWAPTLPQAPQPAGGISLVVTTPQVSLSLLYRLGVLV